MVSTCKGANISIKPWFRSKTNIAIACKIANGTVKNLVYWLILARPCSPSLDNSSSLGNAMVKTWIMMEALM